MHSDLQAMADRKRVPFNTVHYSSVQHDGPETDPNFICHRKETFDSKGHQ